MFKNETKNAMMALAVVAMFMLSACAVLLSPSDADVNGTPVTETNFTINMRVGDSFEYAPDANITGTLFSWSVSPSKPTGMSFNETAAAASNTTKLSFTPTTSGTCTVTLHAEVVTGSHTQEAEQVIAFNVIPKITLQSDDGLTISNGAVGKTLTAGMTADQTYKFSHTGGSSATAFSTPTVSVSNGGVAAKVSASIASSGADAGKLVVVVDKTAPAGTYVIETAASYQTAAANTTTEVRAAESKTLTFTVTIEEGFAITNTPATADTIIGKTTNDDQTINELQITTDASTKGVTGVSYAIGEQTVTSGAISGNYATSISINSSSGKVTFPTTGFSNTNLGTNQSATVTFKVTATGTGNGEQVSTNKVFTLTVYRSLAFTTTPVVDQNYTSVNASSVNGLDVLLSTSIEGAKKVTYNWGDGTEFSRNVYDVDAAFYTANHTYAQPGTYFITITAENDFGESSYITPYTTGAEILWSTDKVLKMTGIDAKTDGDNLTLTGKAIVTDGVTTSYKWTYTSGDIKDKVITNEDKPAWVVSVSGKTLVLTKADVPDNTKFVCEVSATFEGDTEATTSSASYIYNDANFFSKNPWALWIPIIVAAVLLVVMLFVTGFLPPMLIATGLAVIAQIVMLALRFFSII